MTVISPHTGKPKETPLKIVVVPVGTADSNVVTVHQHAKILSLRAGQDTPLLYAFVDPTLPTEDLTLACLRTDQEVNIPDDMLYHYLGYVDWNTERLHYFTTRQIPQQRSIQLATIAPGTQPTWVK